MESSSSGGGLALRRNSGGGGGGGSSGRGSFGGDADPFDIPAKGAPLERLRKWRVSSLLHARRHFVVGERLPVHSGVCVCLYWFGLIVVGFGAECSFFLSPALDACVCDRSSRLFCGESIPLAPARFSR
jgi:hypothetical protein